MFFRMLIEPLLNSLEVPSLDRSFFTGDAAIGHFTKGEVRGSIRDVR